VSLEENVFVGPEGWVPYCVSDDGLLVYASDTNIMNASIVRVDRQGREELLVSVPGHGYRQPSLSPDGRRLALTYMPASGEADLRLFDLERRTLSSITPREFGSWPVWSPDGGRVAFVGSTLGQWTVFSAAADGRGAVESVIPPLEVRQIPTSYSPDGVLAFERGAPDVRDIWLFDASSEPTTRPFLATDANERGARFSPDGAWIAFISNQSGRDEVYVARASGEGGVIPISNDGGREPMWARDSNELFYRNGTRMMSVPIVISDDFDFDPGIPQVLFEGKYSYGYFDWAINYDVSPDGQYFYLAKESDAREPRLQVVTDWVQELERLVPVGN